MDAATGNERRPTVDRRNGGTCSSWVIDDEVGGGRADQQREPADSCMVEQERAAHEMP